MRFVARLVLGTFTVVAITLLVLLWVWPYSPAGAVVLALAVSLGAGVGGGTGDHGAAHLAGAGRRRRSPPAPRRAFPDRESPKSTPWCRRCGACTAISPTDSPICSAKKAESTAIVDAMVEGVIAADAKGRIVTANPAARRLLGYPDTGPLPDLPTLFRSKAAREAVAQVLDGHPVRDREVELDTQVLSLNARPLPGSGAVVVLHDLTAIRRLEQVRRDFVANVSHELKTPLTSISGYAETLADPAIDDATRARFAATILANAHRMQHMVDDLLDLSRVESGRWLPRTEPVDLATIAGESWAALADRAGERQVSLDRQIAPDAASIVADPESIRHILDNLFDNALRHVPVGGHIVVQSARSDAGVTVSVADDGSGIPAEHLPRIFERFYRVDPARSRAEGGTGLGLSIVRHMVEAHGGRVSAESEPRQGTTIRCWFPDVTADSRVAPGNVTQP